MNWLRRLLPERWTLKSALIAAYVLFTVVTSTWYFVGANLGSRAPNEDEGRVYALVGRGLPTSGGLRGPPGVFVQLYVDETTYWVGCVAVANWGLLALIGVGAFLRLLWAPPPPPLR